MTATTNAALAGRPLPEQPAVVREWIAQRNAASRAFTRDLRGMINRAAAWQEYSLNGPALLDGLRDVLQDTPPEVAQAYRAWAAEYNAIVQARRAERQATRNAREVAQVRAQTCPSCFASHAGEC